MDNDPTAPELLARALDALHGLGVNAAVSGEGRTSAVHLHRGPDRWTYTVETMTTLRPSTVALAADRVRGRASPHPVLLVTTHASPETARFLRARGVEFLDTGGNAYLDQPGLLVVSDGHRVESAGHPTHADRVGTAALQVAFVLLRDTDAGSLSVRALGERAGVSHGAAAAALQAFDQRGWIRNLGRRGQHVVDAPALLMGWTIGFTNQLSSKLVISRADPPGGASVERWARDLHDTFGPGHALLGGEAAAAACGHALRPVTASVYVREWTPETMRLVRLLPSPRGAVAVRKAFAPGVHDPDHSSVADPLLLLAELTTIPDERLDTTRAALRERVLARARA